MKTVVIRQVVTLPAKPHLVYEALMDSRKHSRIIGMKASISRKVGGAFTTFDGGIVGSNLELEPDRRIVQEWRGEDWPAGHFSRVTFTLARAPKGTRLTLTHSAVPAQSEKSIRKGWQEFYWEPLAKFLAPA
jgi:activator of HSP90 ATPase